MSLPFLVVDDEPDVEMLFRQQFRRDLRAGRSSPVGADSRFSASIGSKQEAILIRLASVCRRTSGTAPALCGFARLCRARP